VLLHIDSLAFGGEAVGRDESGRVVFVQGGAPGDLLEVRLTEEKQRFARGEIVRVVERGVSRVDPVCAIADRCGGCPWMHVSREAQLAAKQEIVDRALGKLAIEVRQIVAPGPPLGYRVRARWTRRGDDYGYSARRSHEIVNVKRCPALVPALELALLKSRPADGESLAAMINEEGNVEFTDEFAQANHAANAELRRCVREAVGASENILELYAGSGNFTRDLVTLGQRGVAIEGEPRAAARLKRLLSNHSGWRALHQPVSRLPDGKFDVVVLDPPRAGAAGVIDQIAKITDRIVYVSCDPMTLARDLMRLNWRGWAQPIDMMPQTSHIEVVCYMQSTREK
jgi:tRNA/tmRNA/rRNA uracil-C5-methylase (TrmA/RlmC/RlmD family)